MVKVTYRELTPDDPIFHGGVQLFVPAPRPLNPNTKKNDDETNQSSERVSKEGDQALSETKKDDD